MLNIKPFCKFVIHQDLQPSRIKQDLQDVQSVIYSFKSSFITPAEESSLKTLSSGIVSTETLRKVLEKNYKKKTVIGYALVSVIKSIYGIIKKLCLGAFTNLN